MALLTLLVFNCGEKPTSGDPLSRALASQDPKIKMVMDHLDTHEVQVLFTQIDRRNDSVFFTDYSFQVDKKNYFYPASTVKFPIAVLALEKLNETDTLNMDTRFFVEGDTLETTFASDITRVFAVSDNEANNRLLEFLGQDAINERLVSRGVTPVRISHRLGVHSEELTTKPLLIYLNDSTTTPTKPTINSAAVPLQLEKIRKGKGFYVAEEDSIYREPFDFSLKNYYPIQAQHAVLKRVIFPGNFPGDQQFHISEEQREFLLNAMQIVPRKAGYDPAEFYDSYCKFFIFGDSRDPIPDKIKIYNKVGFAFGTLTDCAYIRDTENEVEFLLTATILVNDNGIFNDDHYEYEETGIPFLAALGRELYTSEKLRKHP